LPSRRTLAAYRQVLAEHRERLNHLIERRGVVQVKSLYDSALSRLDLKLSALVHRQKGDTFTAHQLRIFQAQIREGQRELAKRMAGELGVVSRDTQVTALRGLASDVTRLEKVYTGAEVVLPIEEAGRFAAVVEDKRDTLLRMHETSMAKYTAENVGKMEEAMGVSLASGDTMEDVINRVVDAGAGEWWRGERIVRTELSYASNATAAAGILDAAGDLPGMMMRWSEHCDDESYAPLDDRVGVDSIAMHGQIARAGGEFFMPDTAPAPDMKGRTEVPAGLVGLSWEFPPNRPNDRAVIQAWRKEWGVPGWMYVGGQRVSAEEALPPSATGEAVPEVGSGEGVTAEPGEPVLP